MLWEIKAGRDGMSAHVPAKVDKTCLPLAHVRGWHPGRCINEAGAKAVGETG